jgi:hypothetical protein
MPQINDYNSKTGFRPSPQKSTSIAKAQNPTPIRARLSNTKLKGAVVTNPAYTQVSRKRTASMGMGGVGVRGRNIDLPNQTA